MASKLHRKENRNKKKGDLHFTNFFWNAGHIDMRNPQTHSWQENLTHTSVEDIRGEWSKTFMIIRSSNLVNPI